MIKDKRNKKVQMVVNQSIDFVVGGYENAISDGDMEEMPAFSDLMVEVYEEVMATKNIEGSGFLIPVKKDIRFHGTKRIYEMIEQTMIDQELDIYK